MEESRADFSDVAIFILQDLSQRELSLILPFRCVASFMEQTFGLEAKEKNKKT